MPQSLPTLPSLGFEEVREFIFVIPFYTDIPSGHQKYGMFLRYGAPPTPAKWDYRSEVTASDSYIGDKLYSQDIRIETPHPG